MIIDVACDMLLINKHLHSFLLWKNWKFLDSTLGSTELNRVDPS